MMKYAYPFQNEFFFASDAGQELIGRNFGITQKKEVSANKESFFILDISTIYYSPV